MESDIEAEVVPVARELGIGIVAYSPLGRGFLTGQITSPGDFPDGDFRKYLPRFTGDNFGRNLALVDRVRELAVGQGLHPGPAGAGLGAFSRGDDVVPIPGTKRRTYLEENVAAADVVLDAHDLGSSTRCSPRTPPPGPATRTWRRSGRPPRGLTRGPERPR